jgi:hypothetical protein
MSPINNLKQRNQENNNNIREKGIIIKVTPPFDEFGEIRGISISKTTTAKSWKEKNYKIK